MKFTKKKKKEGNQRTIKGKKSNWSQGKRTNKQKNKRGKITERKRFW